jgi:CDP-diacylglycerol---serine O-phosphatidyltransferase
MQKQTQTPSYTSLRGRGIYLLPNLLTTATLFAAFYSMIAILKGRVEMAAIAIFIAMLADSLDGRVARLTNTQTNFGVQYDSLADMVAFGVASAFLVYNWALAGLGKLGWLAAFLFVAATALRLARFNTQAVSADKRYFQGLPCPAAAGVLAGLVWATNEYQLAGQMLSPVVLVLTILLAVAMVSNMRYHSFKQLDSQRKVSFVTVLAIVLLFVCIAIDPAVILFLLFFIYALSGPVITIYHRRKKKRLRKANASDLDEVAPEE